MKAQLAVIGGNELTLDCNQFREACLPVRAAGVSRRGGG
jgi:hypothetical protein